MSNRPVFALVGLAALTLAACHRPHGAIMPYTGGSQTYVSTEMTPKTVRIVDIRSGEVLFSLDIPPGKQLTLDFVEDSGDDPVYTPDLMRWMVWDAGTSSGSLKNSMTVPPSASRRIEVYLRHAPEYAQATAEDAVRVDQAADRPDWWSPRGGEMPEDRKGTTKYDH